MNATESFVQTPLGQISNGNCSPKYEFCVFDLDDTLYPYNAGLAPACRTNIAEYMVERLGFLKEEAKDKAVEFYISHGTTMAGLRANGFVFDFDDFHRFVHGRLPYHLLKQDPILRSLLMSMHQRKFVFTNGDKVHAQKCLQLLGIEDCFEKVLSFETIMNHPPILPYPHALSSVSSVSHSSSPSGSNSSFVQNFAMASSSISSRNDLAARRRHHSAVTNAASVATDSDADVDDRICSSWMDPSGPLICCKPQIESFHRALKIIGAEPAKSVFFDDNVRNIAAAKQVGMATVLVGSSVKCEGSDFAVQNLHNLKNACPDLWEKSDQFDDMLCPKTSAVEYVRA